MEISIFMNFVFISGLFMSLSYLLYKDQKKQNQIKKEQQFIADTLQSKASAPVIITIKREMVELQGAQDSLPSKDLGSFGFNLLQTHGCKKVELKNGVSSDVKELIQDCLKNGLTRGPEVRDLLSDPLPDSLVTKNLYLILSGENPLVAKIYAYVSKY